MVQKRKAVLRSLMVVVAAFMALMIGASSASAYPDCGFSASADKKTVASGGQVTFTGTAAVECAWTIEFNGQTVSASGTSFEASFTAPDVSRATVFNAQVSCTYDDASCSPASAAPAAGNARMPSTAVFPRAAVFTETIPVRVVPDGQGGPAAPASTGGILPNTGGPSFYLLLGALLLLAAGGGVVYASRREQEAVETADN